MLRKEILFEFLVLAILATTGKTTSLEFNETFNESFHSLNGTGYMANNNNGEMLYQVPWYMIAILSTLYGTISILAVLGNGLIVWVVLKNKRMHNVTNYFISNLAMADIVIGVFATPFQFQAALLQYWVLPKIMCKVAPFASTLSVNVSIFTLVAISLDRFYVILYPLKPKLRVKQCFSILVFVWIIALLLSSLHFFNYNIVNTPDNELPRCEIMDARVFKYHVLVLVLIQYVLPFIIIVYTYFRIGYHIYFDTLSDAVNKRQEQNKRKVIKMIFIVVNLFMLCWTPLQLYNILNFISPSINEYKYINILWLAANFFAMSNSCYNVFIYGICSARYKREFRKVLSFLPCIDKSLIDYDMVTQNGFPRRQTTFNKTQKSNSSFVRAYSTAITTLEDTHVIQAKAKQLRHHESLNGKLTMTKSNNSKQENGGISLNDFNNSSSYKIINKKNNQRSSTKDSNSIGTNNSSSSTKKLLHTPFKFFSNNSNGKKKLSYTSNSYLNESTINSSNLSNKSRSFDEVVVSCSSSKINGVADNKYKSRSFNSNAASDIDKQIQKFY